MSTAKHTTTADARPPAVHQVLATLGYGDAIGHEVLGIQRVLRAAGFASDIFVENSDPRLQDYTRDWWEMADELRPQDVLIHHFSIGSRASRAAYALPGKMILIYHNITPPQYFIGVHPLLVQQCFLGRRELSAYKQRVSLALGDSEYNRQELEAAGFPETSVLPVVPSFAHLDLTPNRMVAQAFDDAWTNILFVGRVIPNKGIDDLVRFFHAYKTRFNPRSRLLIVGSMGGFEAYYAMVRGLIAKLGTPDVYFTGHIANEELTAFYDIGDLFLCASEHEGFCVPLIEAFYKRVPVLAYASSAVPGTMDGGGVLYDTKDPGRVAALMDAIISDGGIQEAMLDAQDRALDRLLKKDFGGMLLGFVDRVLALPPVEAPPVRFDFWQQFEQVTRLDEIRQYRPSAYRALPKRQDAAADDADTTTAGIKTVRDDNATDDDHQPVGSGRAQG